MNNRVGEINYNKNGTKMIIIKYNSYNDIIIEFQDEYRIKVNTRYGDFKKGNVKNPYDKTTLNIGYIGVGKYSHKTHKKIYEEWRQMFQRCYDPYEINKRPTYIDCIVCEEWHNFQNYAQWREENYYEAFNEIMCLDKDILIKGNKIYSPQTCIFVPKRINILFTNRKNDRGDLPIGCVKQDDKIRVRCNTIENKNKHLGYFPINQVIEAFTCYKNFKENYIKQVANQYKPYIPIKLYEAMYNYKVEITD